MTSPDVLAASKSTRRPDEARHFSAARAKDRETMALTVENIARELGAECHRDEVLSSTREIHLQVVGPRGLCCGLSFDGSSAQDREGTFCMPWHFQFSSDATLADAFAAKAGASINPHHRRKCTAFAYGFPDLCLKLRACLELANTGEAFQ